MTLRKVQCFFLHSFIFLALLSCTNPVDEEIYMFSYFVGNGEDGLHYAYSMDGYSWEAIGNNRSFLTPEVGGDKLMRDPCIIRGEDGIFHMVWTVSWTEKGIGYANSKDLINWSSQKYLPVMEHEEGTRNTWAPEIYYDKEEDLYIIFWASTISGLFPETQTKEEDGYNHRQYFVTTRDFKEFSDTQLLLDPGFNVIDGSLIKVGEEYLLFIKDETIDPSQKNIKITRSNELTGGYGPPGNPITGDYWAEGPTVTKVGKQWVVYFDKYIDHQMGAVSSTDLVNWKDISEEVSFPEGTRHGTVFKVTKQEFSNFRNYLAPPTQNTTIP